MEEADKDWVMIRMVGGCVFLLVATHPGSPRQRAVKQLLLLAFVQLQAEVYWQLVPDTV